MSSQPKVLNRFTDLSIQGFRRLYEIHLPLPGLFCAMIGANGSGKTSVLDVLSMANSAQGRLNSTITELSGLPSVLTYDRVEDLRLGIAMTVPDHEPLRYA